MQWLRLYSEARTDNKLRTLNDAQHRVWFNLLCYAGEQATRGEIQDCDEFTLAIECAGGDEVLLRDTIASLERLRIVRVTSRDSRDTGVTSRDGRDITFVAWEERQYDKPSDRPEATAERKRRQREKAQQDAKTERPPSNENGVSRDVTPGHATEQIQNRTDTEQNRGESAGADAPPKPKTKRATAMTDEWQPATELYVWAANELDMPASDVNRETFKFKDHFKATGKPMKDWDAAWKNWMRRSREFAPARANPNGHAPPVELSPERIAEHQRKARALGYQGEVRELT